MFILFVCLVSMNLLMIRTEEDIVRIRIEAGDQKDECDVMPMVNLHLGNKFTLQVRSDYFFKESSWNYKGIDRRLQSLENFTYSITNNITKSSGKRKKAFVYSYTGTADAKSGGQWNFKFQLVKNYDPWLVHKHEDVQNRTCSTLVEIDPSSPKSPNATSRSKTSKRKYRITTTTSPEEARSSPGGKDKRCLIILVSVFGILLIVQSSYMLFGRAKNPLSLKCWCKEKRGSKPTRNIADRPPLPLPIDEVVKEKPTPPVSPMSPVPNRHLLFPASAAPMPFENSYESPPIYPLVPKQSYRNKFPKIFNGSDEELRSPGFPRRQIAEPSPRSPPTPPRMKAPAFHLEHRKVIPASAPPMPVENFYEGPPIGPLVSKQSYRNKFPKTFDCSDEEIRSHGFPRRQIAELSPRSPPTPPRMKAPAFHPEHRKEPAPPLHPKNLQVFPPPAPFRRRSIDNSDPRLSDDEWQYEMLQPACKYLNNFNITPYYNNNSNIVNPYATSP